MIFQDDIIPDTFDIAGIDSILGIIIPIVLVIILMVSMYKCYTKLRIPILILVIYLCSLYVGFVVLANTLIPYNVEIQVIFIAIQSIFFILTCIDFYKSYY